MINVNRDRLDERVAISQRRASKSNSDRPHRREVWMIHASHLARWRWLYNFLVMLAQSVFDGTTTSGIVCCISSAIVWSAIEIGNHPLPLAGLLIGAATVLSALLWIVPKYQAKRVLNTTLKTRFDAENEARKTLAQIFGGIVLLVGVYSTITGWQASTENLKVAHQNLQIVQKSYELSELNLQISRESQVADLYVKALGELATPDEHRSVLQPRVGGIYALDTVWRRSTVFYDPVERVLTSYLRQYSPALDRKTPSDNGHELALDVQAAVEVLRRRPRQPLPHGLNLQRVNLARAHLEEGDLEFAELWECNLSKSHLRGADLTWANLWSSNLTDADLSGADIHWAYLLATKGLTAERVRAAKNFEDAFYDCDLIRLLSLSPDHNNETERMRRAAHGQGSYKFQTCPG